MSPIETQLDAINRRNATVELDKAWETSLSRKLAIAALTYATVLTYLSWLGVQQAPLHALVPVAGYLLSTLSLRLFKTLWARRIYRKI